MNHKDKILVQQSLKKALSRVSALKRQVLATKDALKKAEQKFDPGRESAADANIDALNEATQEIEAQIATTKQVENRTSAPTENMADFDPAEHLGAALKKLARGCGCSSLKQVDE